MEDQERKKKILLPNTSRSNLLPIFVIFGLFLFFVFAGIFSRNATAATAPSIITYQGKLLVANHLASTTQSVSFILYDAASAGTVLYTASGTIGSPQPMSVTPVQGLFSVNLGDTGTNPLDPSIFQNNSSVYLEVRIGSDTLSPRKRIASVPYAFNAKYLDGIAVNTISSSVYIPKSDSNGNFTFNSTTISTSTITTLTVLGNTSVGIITSGTWNGSLIAPLYGGTGQNSSGWTGLVKVTAGVWATSTVSLATDVNGVLLIANGGTNSSTLAANGSLIYSDGTRYNAVAVGSSGLVLQSTGSGAPIWVSTSSLGFGTGSSNYSDWTLATSTSDIGYSVTSGVKVIFSGINGITTTRSGSALTIGLTPSGVNAGTYGSANSVPVLTIDAFGRVISNATSSIAIAGNQITSGVVSSTFGGTNQDSSGWTGLVRVTAGVWATTTINLAADVSGVLSIANGGTNSSTLAANGSLIYSDGTRYNAVAVGNSGFVLQSTGSGAPIWVSTSSLGISGSASATSSYSDWTLATSTSDIGYSVTSGVKVVFSGINGVTTTRAGSALSISLTPSGVNAGTYGSANAVPVLTIDSFGRVISNTTSSIAIAGNQIISGVVSSTFGGTNQDSSGWTGLVRVTAGVWATTTINLATDVNGVLSIANGGTNSSTLAANGSLIYSDGTRYNATAVGVSGQILQSTGSGAPVWVTTSSLGFSTSTYSSWTLATSTNDIGYTVTSGVKVIISGINGVTSTRSGSTLTVGLTSSGVNAGTYGSANAVPVLTIDAFGRVTSNSTSTIAIDGNQITSGVVSSTFGGTNQNSSGWTGLVRVTAGVWATTTINLATDVNGVLSIANGGTNSSTLAANGSLIYSDGTRYNAVAVGNSGFVLQSTGSGAPVWVSTSSLGISSGGSFVNLQAVSPGTAQTGFFNISGTGIVGTSFGIGTSTVSSTLTIQGTGGANLLSIVSSTGNSVFKIMADGRIGINTSSPIAGLSLQGIAGVNPFAITSSTGAPLINVLTNGNVGIGTSTPAQKLSVVGNISNIISAGTAIVQVATTAVRSYPSSVFVSGRYAYVGASGSDSISVVDISNPNTPIHIASTSVGQVPVSLYVSGRYAYTANYNSNNISVVDVSNPSAPIQVATTSVGLNPSSIYVSGRYAYVTNRGSDSMSVVDLSNPLLPVRVATVLVGSLPNSIYVSGRYAYVANQNSNNISVVDVSNPSAPIQVATTSVGSEPISIYVSGRYAYVANQNSNNISVVNVSNPAVPVQVATATVGARPSSIYVSGRYAYVANFDSSTISIVDVSNPSAPAQITTTSVSTNPNSIYVSGRYAYVGSGTADALSIIDISGTEVSSLIAHSAEFGNVQSRNDIFAQGNIMAGTSLMVGAGGIMSQGSLSVFASSTGATSSIFSISAPQAPNILKVFANGNIGIGTSTPTQKLVVSGNISNIIDSGTVVSQISTIPVGSNGASSPISIFVSGKYAYVVNNGAANISVVDVSNASAPVQISTTSVVGSLRGIYVSGRYAYVANSTGNSISVIDISNPFAPAQIATTSVGATPQSVYVSGRYLYVANNTANSISVVDISNPFTPVQIATTSVGTSPDAIYVSGRYAYVANQVANSMSVVDISTPALPRQIATVSVGLNPQALYVSGRYAYVVNGGDTEDTSVSSTISIVDISNPSAPVEVATAAVGSVPSSIYVSGRYAYVANSGSSNISVVDVSSATAPAQVAVAAVAAGPFSIYVSGRYAYTANSSANSMSVIDISGTEVSSLIAHSADVGNLQSRNDIFAQGNIMAGTSLLVGAGGIMSNGSLSVFASSTGATSSIFTVSSAASSSIFRIFANGKVGIGTSSPFATLSVNGDLAVTGGIFDSTGSRGTNGQVLQTNGTLITWVSTSTLGLGGGSSVINSGLAGQFSYFAANGTTLTGTSSLFILPSGNIGINTTTPVARLSVVGLGSGSIVDVASSTGSSLFRILADGRIGINSSSPIATLSIQGSDSINPFAITSSTGAPLVNVLTNGNVGIGTSTPTQKLSVVGNISNILDVSTTVAQVATTSVGTSPQSIFVSGRYAYVANNGSNNISVVDVSNPLSPTQIATTTVGAGAGAIYVAGRYAYTANINSNSISIVDISNPKVPIQLSTLTVPNSPFGIYVSGRYAYVSGGSTANMAIVDISNPRSPVQISTASLSGNAYGVYVSGRYAYLSSISSGIVMIVDVSNPSAPVEVSSVSVGGISAPYSIAVSGRYAYVASNDQSYISVVDVVNPAVPVVVATTTAGTNPRNVFISGRYLYVANFGSGNISIIDISSPTAPFRVLNAAVGTQPASIFVSGRYAYVANRSSNNISVVDISGTEVTSLVAGSAEVGNLQSRNDIFAQGNIFAGTSLLVGAGGIMSQGSLSVFASSTGATSSIFNISSPQVSSIFKAFANGAIAIGTSTASSTLTIQGIAGSNPVLSINSSTGSSLVRILANGNVGIGTTTPSQKLSVSGNISNIIDNGTTIAQVGTATVGATPFGVFVSGKYAYVGNYSSSTMSIVDISNPTSPVQISTSSAGLGARSIYVSGRYAYVVNEVASTVSIIDVSNAKFPIQVATFSTGLNNPMNIYVSGRYAYVTNLLGDTVSVIDISNPLSPVQAALLSLDSGSQPTGVYVSGRYAYTANAGGNGTISVIDISNPSAPVQVATTTVEKGAYSIYVSGRYAYVANSTSNTISVVDVSNPSAPVQVATTSVGATPFSIFVSGRYAYVANSGAGTISVVDVATPSAPIQVATTSVATTPNSIFVSGRYAYVTNQSSSTLSVIDISGTEVSSLIAHSADVGNLQSRNDIFAQGNIMAGTSLMVGAGGIMSNGSLSIFASSTGATSSIFSISSAASSSILRVFANGSIGIGTSTPTATLDVQGTVEVNLVSTTAATFALCHTVNGPGADQVISDCTGTPAADYMEMYPADSGLQMGDVVVLSNNFVTTLDGNSVPKLSKATSAYQVGLIGVISDPSQAGDFNSIGYNIAAQDNPLPLALNGRVKIKVTNINGDIHTGDKLTSSNIAGVAMKATGEGPVIAIAMGDYTSASVGTVMGFVNTSWNNTLHQALTLDTASNNVTFGTSTNPYNLAVSGNISLVNSNIVNKLSFATSTLFESSVGSFAGARAFTFNAINFNGPLADNYIISLRANNNSVFSVAANGDVHALGNYYGASAVLGTSTNPGDLAERVDIAIDDTVEAGDVVMVDKHAPDSYRRSNAAYEESVAGVISTNPTIIVGNGRTDYTAVMAMVGRVPVKVSAENGAIVRGDLLVAASLPGYAMKYDATKDTNNKMVGVIGVALESLPASSSGKILALIRTGWVYNRDKDISSIQDTIEQLATAQGINLNATDEPGNLTVENTDNQLTYTGGNLNLQNNSLINVATILGKNNKWKIDEFGNLIQRITTAVGDKEIYGLQSSGKQEIVISGTSTLENGMRRVVLTDLDQAIIDKTVPLKISITMSGETKGFYVSERNFDSFVVKENENGNSNAPFDWIVIAKVLPEGQTNSVPADQTPTEAPEDQSDSGNPDPTPESPTPSSTIETEPTSTPAPTVEEPTPPTTEEPADVTSTP